MKSHDKNSKSIMCEFLLCLIVPDADRAVERAGGYKGFANADGQTSDGVGVEGLGQELKM